MLVIHVGYLISCMNLLHISKDDLFVSISWSFNSNGDSHHCGDLASYGSYTIFSIHPHHVPLGRVWFRKGLCFTDLLILMFSLSAYFWFWHSLLFCSPESLPCITLLPHNVTFFSSHYLLYYCRHIIGYKLIEVPLFEIVMKIPYNHLLITMSDLDCLCSIQEPKWML